MKLQYQFEMVYLWDFCLPGIVSEPDTEVLDLEGLPLGDLLNTDDLSGGLLELAELTEEVPEAGRRKRTNIYSK